MRIKIQGRNKNFPKAEMREFLAWAGDRLGIGDDVLLIVHQKKGLGTFESGNQSYTTMALCGRPNYDEFGNVKTLFVSIVNQHCKRYQTASLAHELVHCVQYVRGAMKDHTDHLTLWKGRLIKDKGPGAIPYRDAPWEKEAFRREKSLMRAWRKKCQKQP